MVTVLTIDGGGIRGLLPAIVLREIRRRLANLQEHRPFFRLFDLIAGTSTGALIALALSLPNESGAERFAVTDLVELYERRGTEIFPPSFRSALHTAVQAFRHKYSAEPFERLLLDVFGEESLQSAATNLLITSFDTEAMQPHCMKRHLNRRDWVDDADYYMRDVARASAAAPTYFPPAHIGPIGDAEKKFSLIDGAMFANNPSGLAYVESTKIYPEESEFLILSLGTGDPQQGYRYEEVHSWGYLEWVNPMKGFPIGAIMSAGQSEAVSHQLGRMSGVRYVRLNVPLNGCAMAMDDASARNLSCLASLADRMIEQYDESIDEICRLLAGRSAPEVPAGE
ncbi:MAG TPA: patatin-like phospholipase family protein [Spirochaetia bacterium]|nr:patatin-like phospholipase family protein [Spirochaetia bacterium]